MTDETQTQDNSAAEAAAKVAAKAQADAAKAAKKAEADAKKAARDADKQAKADAKAAKDAEAAKAKADREAAAIANKMPEQNGVRRPKPDTLCGKAWAVMDSESAKLGQPVSIADTLKVSNTLGLVEGNVKAEYARWRKFNGVTGRVMSPEQVQAVADKQAAKEKAAADRKEKAEAAAVAAKAKADAAAAAEAAKATETAPAA